MGFGVGETTPNGPKWPIVRPVLYPYYPVYYPSYPVYYPYYPRYALRGGFHGPKRSIATSFVLERGFDPVGRDIDGVWVRFRSFRAYYHYPYPLVGGYPYPCLACCLHPRPRGGELGHSEESSDHRQ